MRKLLTIVAFLISSAAAADDRVSVSDLHVENSGAVSLVQGVVHNNSNATLANVFVRFKLYDSAGNVVGNTIAQGQDIGPGENWKFSAPATQSFSKVQVSGVQIN